MSGLHSRSCSMSFYALHAWNSRGELIFSPSENTSNSLRVVPRALAQARRCVLSDGGRVKPIGNGSAE